MRPPLCAKKQVFCRGLTCEGTICKHGPRGSTKFSEITSFAEAWALGVMHRHAGAGRKSHCSSGKIGLLLKVRTRDGPDVGHGARRPVELGRVQLRHAMARAEAADIGRAGDGRKLDGPIAAILSCGGEPRVIHLFMTNIQK